MAAHFASFQDAQCSNEEISASHAMLNNGHSGDRTLPTGKSSYISTWLDHTASVPLSSSPFYHEPPTNQATTVVPVRCFDLVDEPLFYDQRATLLNTADLQTTRSPEPFSISTTLVQVPHTYQYSQSNSPGLNNLFEGHGEVGFSTSECTPSFVAGDHQVNTQPLSDMPSGIPADNEQSWVKERGLMQEGSPPGEVSKRVISPTESELLSSGFEFHSQLAEEVKTDYFNHDKFRRAMKHIGPDLPRKLQWYIYKEAEKTVEQRCECSRWDFAQQVESHLSLDDVEKVRQIADSAPSNNLLSWLDANLNTWSDNTHIPSSLKSGNSPAIGKQSIPNLGDPTALSWQPYPRITEKRPDTPRPFDPNIRKSVERDASPRCMVRGSTPAYEDRSLSPSPASRRSDTDMLDAPRMDSRTRQGSMPPPPTTSRTSSPRRDIQTHSQNKHDYSSLDHTTSSSHIESRTSSHFCEYHTNPHSSPSTPRNRTGAKTIPGLHLPVKPHETSPYQLSTTKQTNLHIPSPPLIPVNSLPSSIHPAKRGQRRKSLSRAHTNDKVEKQRSVTSGVGTIAIAKKDSNSNKVSTTNGKGTTTSSVAEKRRKVRKLQRAVTLNLERELR